MISPRALRLLIYSVGVLLLISLKFIVIESLGMSRLVTLDFEVYGRVQGSVNTIYTQWLQTVLSTSLLIFTRIYCSLANSTREISYRRMYTQRQGKRLGLTGWCMNTERGTVVGQMQGEKSKIEEMKLWLQHKGSPSSSIEKAEFRNEKDINELSMTDFSIKK